MLEEIALTAELAGRLTIPTREAFALARQLLGRDALKPSAPPVAPNPAFVGSLALGPFLHLGVDLLAWRTELHARLERAIESQVRPRRGRPRKHRSARTIAAKSSDV